MPGQFLKKLYQINDRMNGEEKAAEEKRLKEQKIAVKVEDLTMSYRETPVLWDIDINIPEASISCIVGPNGAGKSTLIKGILGLMDSLSGEVRIMGKTYKEVYKDVVYVPQSSSMNQDFPATVADVCLMGRYAKLGYIKRPRKEDKEIADKALERMGMSEYKNRQISELSGGQKQRVLLASAMAREAEVYFLDEPLQGIDIQTEKLIMEVFKEFQAEGKTVIVVHHDLNTVEEYFDYIVMLNKRLIVEGPVSEVFTDENLAKTYRSTKRRRVK